MTNRQDSFKPNPMKLQSQHIILSFIIGLTAINLASAQNKFSTFTADRYFENTYYQKAIPIYEKYLKHNDEDFESMLKLADAYFYTYDLENAELMYSKLNRLHRNKMNSEANFRMIQTFKALGKYEKANELYKTKLIHNENELAAFESKLKYLDNVEAIGDRFEIENLSINTETSEFSTSIYQDSLLVYAANKKAKGIFNKIFHWNAMTYLNLYSIPKENLDVKPKLLSNEISTRFHESSAVFTKDGKTIYFTRNNYFNNEKNTDNEKINHLQIYKAELVNGKWTNLTSLPINSDSFSTEHPALSNDEETLYFSSDRPGGFGSFDLYKVNTKNFENPENLGAEINTNHREQFPFISKEGDLYFSSNGHPGFGLLDVFLSKTENGEFQKPDNIGQPVNSGYDDFAFYLIKDKDGYFSSNRPSGQGSDDIYKFKETKELIIEDCYQLISGKSLHKITNEILPNTKIELIADDEIIETFTTGEDGVFEFKIECEKNYTITANKTDFEGDSKNFRTNDVRKKENNVDLFLISPSEIEKIQAKKEAEREAKLAEKIKAEKQAEAERKAKIERAAKQKIMTDEPNIIEKNQRIFIKTEPIYFDYDLWYIRKESRVVLNKVVDILKKYPEMKIEIGTHTDIRGNVKYNQKLSLKRSNSVLDYFESQGIDRNRILAKGYGESQPIIHCETEESCTEEQHEINRRCEFEILSFTE